MLPISVGHLPPTKLDFSFTQKLIQQNLQTPQTESGSFVNLLSSGIDSVNAAQHNANDQVHALLTGGDVSQAEVLTAVQKADMSFRLLMQIRNKLISAYEELNGIRV